MRNCLRLGRAKWSPFKPLIRWGWRGDGDGAAIRLGLAAGCCALSASSCSAKHARFSLRSYSSHARQLRRPKIDAGEDDDILRVRGGQGDIEKAIASLEHFLPPELRRHEGGEGGGGKKRTPKNKRTLYQRLLNNLAKTRYKTGIDALAYLAIDLDRWPAAQYLFNLLLDNAEHISRGTRRGWLPCNLNWPEGRTLDQISDVNTGAILHENLCKPDRRRFAPLSQLDDYLEDLMIPDQSHPTTYTRTMSHIWSSLGSMLLRAAELPSDKAQVVMDRFRQIVGRLHHGGLIPDDVYRDASASGSRTIPGRNHALSLLSTRIMFCLSEAEFNASDADHPSGIVPPKPSIFGFKIRQRNLGVEVWLELILRCCIEGGFVNDGLRIVCQTKQSQQAPWNIKPTPRILQSPLATNFDSRLIDCCDTWEECAAYAGEKVDIYPDRPFMGVGKLSVSRDTVMCILDSLANRLTVGVGPEGNAATTTLRSMGEIINFMNEDHVGLNPKERHYFAMRILQVKSIIPEVNPKAAQSLLKLLSPDLHFTPETASSHSQDQVSESNFFLGMAQNILNIFAASGHIVGAESLMQWLLSAHGTLPEAPSAYTQQEIAALIRPLSPLSIALLMNSSATARQLNIGHGLIKGHGANPPLIPPEAYHMSVITPSIIRFAGASGNFGLIQLLSQYHSGNWTTSAVKALFEYTVEDEDWTNAEKLFLFLRDTRETHWGVSQIMQVAASLVRLEQRSMQHEQPAEKARCTESLHKGLDFLARVLRGHFGIVIEFTDQTRYDYQELVLWEIHKILLTVPGITSKFCQSFKVAPPRRGVPEYKRLPPEAFNRLLAAIVEAHGSVRGQKLWERWCIEPWEQPHRQAPESLQRIYEFCPERTPSRPSRVNPAMQAKPKREMEATLTKLAVPNLNTVRIIVRGALRELDEYERQGDDVDRKRQSKARAIVGWAKGIFRKFNYDDGDLRRELERYQETLRNIGDINYD